MSAYIVSDNHINVIVSYFVDYRQNYKLWYELNGNFGYMSEDDAPKVAHCLYEQNVKSVDARYDEENGGNYQFKFIRDAKQLYSIGEIALALDGLEYQSCETDDYHQTDAYKIVQAMRKHLLRKMQERDNADTWHIDEVKQSTRITI